MRPKPTTPTVMSRSVRIWSSGAARPHFPRERAASSATTWRVAARMNAKRVVGDLVDAIVRHVADGDAPRPGRVEIDVIHADAVTHDDLRPRHGCDHVGVHRGELRDDRVGVGH